jgi:uncharacterized membrane protein YcaP (DUF421 family)
MDGILGVDWNAMFMPTTPLAELIVRGSIMYLALFSLLRIILRREAAAISVADLLMVVLIADAAQNGITGDYKSVTDGLILVTTILFWNYLLDRLAFHFSLIGRFVHPPPLLLVKDGRLLYRNMRKEYITEEELMTQLREQGIETLDEVKCARMEGDGRISVITHERGNGAQNGHQS